MIRKQSDLVKTRAYQMIDINGFALRLSVATLSVHPWLNLFIPAASQIVKIGSEDSRARACTMPRRAGAVSERSSLMANSDAALCEQRPYIGGISTNHDSRQYY